MLRRYRTHIVVGLVVVLAVGGLMFAMARRDRFNRAAPAWLDPHQPPDGVAAELSTLTAAQSQAANGCTPLSACCADRTAGARVRRTYPGSLAYSDGSFIRVFVKGQVG